MTWRANRDLVRSMGLWPEDEPAVKAFHSAGGKAHLVRYCAGRNAQSVEVSLDEWDDADKCSRCMSRSRPHVLNVLDKRAHAARSYYTYRRADNVDEVDLARTCTAISQAIAVERDTAAVASGERLPEWLDEVKAAYRRYVGQFAPSTVEQAVRIVFTSGPSPDQLFIMSDPELRRNWDFPGSSVTNRWLLTWCSRAQLEPLSDAAVDEVCEGVDARRRIVAHLEQRIDELVALGHDPVSWPSRALDATYGPDGRLQYTPTYNAPLPLRLVGWFMHVPKGAQGLVKAPRSLAATILLTGQRVL